MTTASLDEPKYPVASADRILDVLELLADRGEVRVAQVAEELGIARSTAHRLLAVLKVHEFAVQDANRVYRAGVTFDKLSRRVSRQREIRECIRAHMRELTENTGVTTRLMVLVGIGARFVDAVESDTGNSLGYRTGMLLPAHVTSGGKAMLAELPQEQLWLLYPRGLPATARAPQMDLRVFSRHLREVRARGYATNIEESAAGVIALGASIGPLPGYGPAAVTVALARDSATESRCVEVGKHLRACAVAISRGDLRPTSLDPGLSAKR